MIWVPKSLYFLRESNMSLSKFTLMLISSQVWTGGDSSVCVCVFLTLWLKYYWLLQKEDTVNIHAQVFFWTHTCIFSWADTWEWSGRIIQSVWAQHFRTCQLPPVSTFSLWMFQLLRGTLGTWEGRSSAIPAHEQWYLTVAFHGRFLDGDEAEQGFLCLAALCIVSSMKSLLLTL